MNAGDLADEAIGGPGGRASLAARPASLQQLAVCSWPGADLAPIVERTTSKEASGKGMFSVSPSWKVTRNRSAMARSCPRSRRAVVYSIAVTSQKRRAASAVLPRRGPSDRDEDQQPHRATRL